MREIKFRALRNRVWYYFDFKNRNRWARELLKTMAENEDTIEFEAFVQFTGLLDKNSKEIYEGDIIRADWGQGNWVISKGYSKDKFGHYQLIAEIMFEDGAFVLGIRDDCYRDMAGEHNNLHYEVIGNIYENPDLTPLH